jgi:hypothetical protein
MKEKNYDFTSLDRRSRALLDECYAQYQKHESRLRSSTIKMPNTIKMSHTGPTTTYVWKYSCGEYMPVLNIGHSVSVPYRSLDMTSRVDSPFLDKPKGLAWMSSLDEIDP